MIVQFGGQTPLNLVKQLEEAGVPVIGTSPDAIDRAEDRERFQNLIKKLDLNSHPIALFAVWTKLFSKQRKYLTH